MPLALWSSREKDQNSTVKMPCVVSLRFSRQIIVVKNTWCQKNFEADTVNYGSRPGKITKIFFSPDKSERPNFALKARKNFNISIAACYYGCVLDYFGKEISR